MVKNKAEEKKEKKIKQIELSKNIVKTNHEFLFIYDAKLCNPNGDPGNENKPRMNEEREINLVSDTRLKRYIRDYLQQYKKKRIFVSKLEGKPTVPEKILKKLEEDKNSLEYKNNENKIEFYLKNLIDIRMFGCTIAIKNCSEALTGPIQINWGYSLNPVTLNKSDEITTTFASSEKATQGSMGKDYRVNYSLIAFYGNIIANKAWNNNQENGTLLTDDDIELFDEAIIQSIPLLSTRSKIGQYPRFYIRFEYSDPNYLYGDLRKLVKCELTDESIEKKIKIENISDISEIRLDVSKLEDLIKNFNNEYIKETKTKLIKSIKFWKSEDLILKGEINV